MFLSSLWHLRAVITSCKERTWSFSATDLLWSLGVMVMDVCGKGYKECTAQVLQEDAHEVKVLSSTILLELSPELCGVSGWRKGWDCEISLVWVKCSRDAYLESSQQLAATLNTGDVKKEVDGTRSDFWPVFSVSLDSVQNLLFILVSTHLAWRNKRQGRKNEENKLVWELQGRSERSEGTTVLCPVVGLGPWWEQRRWVTSQPRRTQNAISGSHRHPGPSVSMISSGPSLRGVWCFLLLFWFL